MGEHKIKYQYYNDWDHNICLMQDLTTHRRVSGEEGYVQEGLVLKKQMKQKVGPQWIIIIIELFILIKSY